MRRAAIGAVLVLLLAGGCVRVTQPDGTHFCGQKIPTGAEVMVATPVQDPGPRPADGPVPIADELPAAADPAVVHYAGAAFVRVSDSCGHGARVVVRPVLNASLLNVVRAKDHLVAVLVMQLTGPVTVQAWRSGKFAGSIRLQPGG